MRRFGAAGAAMVMCLVLLGVPATAQSPSVPPVATWVTGSEPRQFPGSAAPSPSAVLPSAPAPVASPTAEASAASAVTLVYPAQSQVEVISPRLGVHIYIDYVDADLASSPPVATDILLITHSHPDHFNVALVKPFPGRKFLMSQGVLVDEPGLRITGIGAAHNEGDSISGPDATDTIFLIELEGLRIAHFGDLGQKELTAEQMATLGRVDVAFSQLENPYSGVDAVNKIAFGQMDQVKPAVLLPTHVFGSRDAAQLASTSWDAYYTDDTTITVRADQLPAPTTVVFMADNAPFGPMLSLPTFGG